MLTSSGVLVLPPDLLNTPGKVPLLSQWAYLPPPNILFILAARDGWLGSAENVEFKNVDRLDGFFRLSSPSELADLVGELGGDWWERRLWLVLTWTKTPGLRGHFPLLFPDVFKLVWLGDEHKMSELSGWESDGWGGRGNKRNCVSGVVSREGGREGSVL